jgi:hypothetical protein
MNLHSLGGFLSSIAVLVSIAIALGVLGIGLMVWAVRRLVAKKSCNEATRRRGR